MFRRALVLAGAALALAGCSGESGLRAQELLQQAATAQAQLSSSSFEADVAVTADGEKIALEVTGKTAPGGQWFSLRAKNVPGRGAMSMQLLIRGKRAWLDAGDGWRTMPAPAAAHASGTVNAAAFQQLARYVKDVRVTEHQLIEGKQTTTLAGAIDTQAMIEAFSGLAGATGRSVDLSKLGASFGDIQTVLSIDEATHLLHSALVSFSVEAQGRHAALELRYRLTSANKPVELPTP